MTNFNKDFDEIVIDLCGKLPEKVIPLPEVPGWSKSQQIFNDFEAKLRRDMYEKTAVKFRHEDFVGSFCEKSHRQCRCGKDFIIYFHRTHTESIRNFDYENMTPYDVMDLEHQQSKRYHCMFCGTPFRVINGIILRFELMPADLQYYYRRQN